MKKQRKQLIVLLAVLVLLGGGYLGLRQYNKVQSEKSTKENGNTIVALEPGSIIKFAYDYEGTEYAYEKKDDVWYHCADLTKDLIQYRLTSIVDKMEKLTVEDTLTGVSDMGQYGLEEPSRTFSFETAEESYEFYVGDYNEITRTYYICRPGEDVVYTVTADTVNSMNLDVTEIVKEEESAE